MYRLNFAWSPLPALRLFRARDGALLNNTLFPCTTHLLSFIGEDRMPIKQRGDQLRRGFQTHCDRRLITA